MDTVQAPGDHCHPTTIFLWTAPRSLSTVFTKCVSFVDDIQIWFEPYGCAYESQIALDPSPFVGNSSMVNFCKRYLASHTPTSVLTANTNPSWMEETEMTYSWVKSQLERPEISYKYIFVKDMAYTVNGDLKCEWLPNIKSKHTFFIRNPLKVYPSYKRAVLLDPEFSDNPDSNDIERKDLIKDYPFRPIKLYYHYLHRLWKAVKSQENTNPIVIDADELTKNPETLLQKYFDAVGFPWKENHTWDAGKEVVKYWKTSKQRMDFSLKIFKIWYQRAVESSMFVPDIKPLPLLSDLSPDLLECVNSAMPYYREMFENRIRPLDESPL